MRPVFRSFLSTVSVVVVFVVVFIVGVSELVADTLERPASYMLFGEGVPGGVFVRGLYCCGLPLALVAIVFLLWALRRLQRRLAATASRNAYLEEQQAKRDRSGKDRELRETIIETMPAFFFAKDADDSFRYLLCNRAFAEFVGKTVDEVEGSTDAELFASPFEASHYLDDDARAMSGSGGVDIRETSTDSEGVEHHIKMVKAPFSDSSGRRMLIGCGIDVTDLEDMRRNEQINGEVLRNILVPTDFSETIEQILATMTREVHCDRIQLFLKNEQGELKQYREMRSDRLPMPIDGDAPEAFWRKHVDSFVVNKAIVYDPTIGMPDPAEFAPMYPDDAAVSFIGMPVFLGSEFLGVMAVTCARAYRFRESDEQLLRSIVNITALAVVRERQNRALQTMTTRNMMILDNIDIPLALYDSEGRVVQVNENARKPWNVDPGDIEKTPYPCRKWAKCGMGEESCPVAQAFRDGRSHQVFERDYVVNARPILNENGAIVSVVKSAVDVSVVNRLSMNWKLVNECLSILLRESDMFEAVRLVLEKACRHLGASRCGVCRFDPTDGTVSTFAEYVPGGTGYVLGSVKNDARRAADYWKAQFAETRVVEFPDLQKAYFCDGLEGYRDYIVHYNARSLYAFRIMLNGEMWGFVGFFYEKTPHELAPAESEFSFALAHCVELMLMRKNHQDGTRAAMAREQAIRCEKERLLFDVRTMYLCLEGLFQEEDDSRKAGYRVVKALAERFGASRCYSLRFDPRTKRETLLAEHTVPGKACIFPDDLNIVYDENDLWYRKLAAGDDILLPDLSQEAQLNHFSYWRDVLRSEKTQTLYICGYRLNGKLGGDIGLLFDRGVPVPEFNDSEREILRSAANLIGVMLMREENKNELVRSRKKAVAADDAKSAFLASMSHEIRTPLNAVIGFSELLQDDTLPRDERMEYLASINSAGNALLALINDVLDISKLEAGQMVFSPQESDFHAMIDEMRKVFHEKCASRGLLFIDRVPGDFPILWIDRLRVRQVLFNLIGNAVKFTNTGSVAVEAEFKRDDARFGTFRFRVVDTGIGISEEDQQQLFHPFVQAKALRGTQAEKNGTGLGLAICRRMASNMNGQLTLESAPGKGSTFTFVLYNVQYKEYDRVYAARVPRDNNVPDERLKGLRVLIVDDIAINLRVLAALLRKIGCKTVTAANADQAFDALACQPVDFILTDLWMPGLSGAEFAAKVRADARFAAIPIAAVTADLECANDFNMSVFDGYLTKPVTIAKLNSFFARVVKKRDAT